MFLLGALFIPEGYQIFAPLIIALSFWLPHLIGNRKDFFSLPVLGLTGATYGGATFIATLGIIHPVTILAIAGLTLAHLFVNLGWENGVNRLQHGKVWSLPMAVGILPAAIVTYCIGMSYIFMGNIGLGISIIISSLFLTLFLHQPPKFALGKVTTKGIVTAQSSSSDITMPDTMAMHAYGYIDSAEEDPEEVIDDAEPDDTSPLDEEDEKTALLALQADSMLASASDTVKPEKGEDICWKDINQLLQETDYYDRLSRKGTIIPMLSEEYSTFSRMSHLKRVEAVAFLIAKQWRKTWNVSEAARRIGLGYDKIRFFSIASEIGAAPFFHYDWGVSEEYLDIPLFDARIYLLTLSALGTANLK
ncbi:hypothetical protein ES705_35639 [subsurface metagenome]